MAPRFPQILTREQAIRLLLEAGAIVFSVLLALLLNGWREDRALKRTLDRVEATIREEVVYNRAQVGERVAHHETLAREILEGTRVLHRLTWLELGTTAAAVRGPEDVQRLLTPLFEATGRPAPTGVRPAPPGTPGGPDYVFELEGVTLKVRFAEGGLDLLGSGNVQLEAAWIRNTAWDTMQVTGAALHLDYDLVVEATTIYHLQAAYLQTVARALDLLYAANLEAGPQRFDGFGHIVADMARTERTLIARYDALLARLDG